MPPLKSEAQRRKLHKLVAEGKMSQAKLEEYEADSPKELPEKVGPAPSMPKQKRRQKPTKLKAAMQAANKLVKGKR